MSDRLRMRGWQVPTYPMPNDLDHLIVQRIVCRADFGMNNAIEFNEDMKIAIDELNNSKLIQIEKKSMITMDLFIKTNFIVNIILIINYLMNNKIFLFLKCLHIS